MTTRRSFLPPVYGTKQKERCDMTKNLQPYDYVSSKSGFDVVRYMDKQPRMMDAFEKHAEVETELFRNCGLMCKCDEPKGVICATCGLPSDRLLVLAAEVESE